MARKHFSGADGEDSQALTNAWDSSIDEYKSDLGPVSITDMIELFDGDRNALARSLAGLPATGAIAKMSRTEQTSYGTQAKNIDRWLRYEHGERGKQARNVERSRATQDKIKNLFARRNPPQGEVTATITGWIGYNNDWRYRSISIPAIGRSVDTEAFNAAMQAGDTGAAYRALFDAYAPGLTVAQADSFSIDYIQ